MAGKAAAFLHGRSWGWVVASMTWVRVDSGLASNHKILELLSERGGDHAVAVYVFGLGHCALQGTDGFIPSAAVGLFHGKPRDTELLVKIGLWRAIPGGFEVNDWSEYQPSDADSQARSEKAKRAAAARWGKENQRK